jgi:hypothetical protein
MRDDARCDVLASDSTEGTHIRIAGRVIDGDGAGVPDAMLEIWQANHHGRYNHPADRRDLPLDSAFTGYGRMATQADGGFCFTTIKPGAVPFDERRLQAPHISVAVLGRGRNCPKSCSSTVSCSILRSWTSQSRRGRLRDSIRSSSLPKNCCRRAKAEAEPARTIAA